MRFNWLWILLFLAFLFMTKNELLAQNNMKPDPVPLFETKTACRVEKDGADVFIRCSFNSDNDLLHRVGKGANKQISFLNTMLVAADTNSAVQAKGEEIHGMGDDCTPWNLNGTYIGANHGCSDVRALTCSGHNKTASDLGSEWIDAAGVKFYIIRIVDSNRVWVLSENKGRHEIWKFNPTITGSSLTNTASPEVINISSNQMAQLIPACRIQRQEYLLDGKKPLPEKKAVDCSYLDIVEEYDIINPASLLDKIRQSPGKERDFVGADLDGVIHNRIIYRFLPNGAIVVYHTSKALQQFNIGYMGFIQSAKLRTGNYRAHEYYIPKTKPFSLGGINYDFQKLQDFRAPVPASIGLQASAGNIVDEQDLPDRFVQLLGDRENGIFIGKVAFAMGYSPVSGVTKTGERARNTSSGGFIYSSSKSYPCALNNRIGTTVPAGTVFSCTAYRTYFDPRRNPNATCVYWYKDNDDYLVCLDYHRGVDNEIVVLPREMAGKKISIIEKTASFRLLTDKTVPAKGIMVSVTNEYGYSVLRIAD